ncbi:MAG: cytochrome c, partial [Acidobacteria bacterium]|nr:cytochrome c [Acidobacteriota bacterium]
MRLTLAVAGLSFAVAAGASGAQGSWTTVGGGGCNAEQAERGEAVYRSHCLSCHQADFSGTEEASALSGEPFMESWREDTVGNLYTRVRNLMPFDEPASLGDDAYVDSVAYLLQVNGFPAGPRELTAAGAADVRIEAEDGPGDVPSFALVSVVGCLERGDGGDWMLTRAAPAIRTADPSESSPEALAALADRPLGTRTFELMAVYPDPAAHAGHRMEAKGFLIRSPDGDRVNVSTLG